MSTIKDRIFVEVALRKSAIDHALLRQALANQEEMGRFGITRFIGAIVAEKQPALRDTTARIVEELAEYSIRCPKCKEPAAVSSADRNGNIRCEPCGVPIVYTDERISEEDLSTTIGGGARRAAGRKKRPKEEPRPAAAKPAAPVETWKPVPVEIRKPSAPAPVETRKPSAAPPARKAAPPAAPQHSEPPPTAEVTKFRIEKLIAGSPSGKLYRIQPSGELGALKIIDRALCADKVQLKRWIDYMQLAQDLPRSAMLKPAQLFREGSLTYIVRPFLDGSARSARAEIDAGVVATEGQAAFASQLLGALLSFHSANLVHGNLTPENAIITSEGACLTDPGLWILFQGLPGEERVVRLWERSRYHAPEVLRGCEPTAASDIYSAGRILEDLFRLSGKSASSEAGLVRFVARMVAEDSVQRYPSAREALWDLRSGAALERGQSSKGQATAHGAAEAEPAAAVDSMVAGKPGRRARISGREKRLQFTGLALLLAVTALLVSQAASWYSTRQAMASPSRPDAVSATLLQEEIATIRKKDGVGAWKQLEETLRGTSWEETAREAAKGPMAAAARRREGEDASKIAAAQARVDAGDWAAAIAILLPAGKEPLSREARDVLARAAEGLHEKEGMVCVPGVDGPEGRTKPFLVDAAPLTRAAGDGDSSGPESGLSFDAAQEIARARGKRLITGKEWDAAVRFSRSGSPRELGPERITGLEGSLLQWVEDESNDDLVRAGYGFCRGGSRPLVPGTSPVRRRKSGSHQDVGVRLVRDLPSP